MKLAGLLLLAASTVASAQDAPKKARIEGVVTDAASGAPLPGARVTIERADRNPGARGLPPGMDAEAQMMEAQVVGNGSRGRGNARAAVPATTDDRGVFAFEGIDPGVYTLEALADGFVSQRYGQRYVGGPGAPATLAAGQELKDVAIVMTPAGTISGRLLDSSGQPLVNVQAQLLRYAYDANGRRSYQPVASARSNDRGEYRIYWVTPGRYYLMAGSESGGSNFLLTMSGGAPGRSWPR